MTLRQARILLLAREMVWQVITSPRREHIVCVYRSEETTRRYYLA